MHRLSHTPRSLSEERYVANPAWEGLHREYHRTLLSRCPSRWLRSYCDNLAEQHYRFRQIAARRSFAQRDAHAEHVAIFEAVIDGRADDAVQALAAHYSRTAAVVADQARAAEAGTAAAAGRPRPAAQPGLQASSAA